jgi:hypothetical protein
VWAETVLPKEDRIWAYQKAEKFIKEALPTPDSVDMPFFNYLDEEDAKVVRASDDVWEYGGGQFRQYDVHTTFTAQNRHGATIRYELNIWLYQNAADKEDWRRGKFNIVDPTATLGTPERTAVEIDAPDSQKPRRATMPAGWTPAG